MSTFYYYPQIPDSTNTSQQEDTVHSPVIEQQYPPSEEENPAAGYFPEIPLQVLQQQATYVKVVPIIETGTPVRSVRTTVDNTNTWNTGRNFFSENGLTGIVSKSNPAKTNGLATARAGSLRPAAITPHSRFLSTQDWLLGIFLFLTLLFIWIRIFYSKFFATLANSLISFQISAKLFREKNVLVNRVSFVLDFVYILVVSVFLYEFAVHFGIADLETSPFRLFLIFLNAIIFYTLLRLFVLRLTGYLFLVQPVFSEYVHNTFVINKGIGIALFPVIIMAHYFPNPLISYVLILGMIIYLVAFILKSIRAYQIIIRKDILLFYLILYLCTLEILPLLLGYKFVTSLI
jgi:hypothetical protein